MPPKDHTRLPKAEGPLPDIRAVSFRVLPEDDGLTVGQILRKRLMMSRRSVNHAKYLANGIMLDDDRVRTCAVAKAGQVIHVVIGDEPEAVAASSVEAVAAPQGGLDIVYEDDDILVIDKPAGLTMHPSRGYGNETLSNYLVAYAASRGRQSRPHIANRLDKGTSGLMVCALSGHVQAVLQRTMHNPLGGRYFDRTYLAVCRGAFPPDELCGTIDAPMARIMYSPCVMGVAEGPAWETLRAPDAPGIVEARTNYEVVAQNAETDAALVRFMLETGRTHQIRVHAAHIGHPLVGDALYGADGADCADGADDTDRTGGADYAAGAGDAESDPQPLIARPALHSAQLDFTHPITQDELHFTSELPQDMRDLLETLHIAVS